MASEAVLSYINKLREKKVDDGKIVEKLVDAGWDKDTALEMLKSASDDDLPPAPPPTSDMGVKIPQQKGSMWDAFEHILLFISLYVLATTVALALLTFVDRWFPYVDDTSSYSVWNGDWQKSLLRGYISAIIVSYPVFSFFFYRVTKRTLANPALRLLKSRKILIYLTLVITFIIMLGYIIGTIFSMLNGNITMNFVFRLFVILGISGFIFTYYLYQVREDRHYD